MFDTINLHKHCLIEASAGTGKTYTIERIVLRLVVEEKALLENVLVVTYTEAAAAELRSRIRSLLQKAADNSLEDYYVNTDDAREHLRNQIFNFDRAAIYTIHGFCNRVISRWPREAGVSTGNEIVDEKTQADELIAEEMRSVWETWDAELGGMLSQVVGQETLEKFRTLVCSIAASYAPGLTELEPLPEENREELCRDYLKEKSRVEELTRKIRELVEAFLILYAKVPQPHPHSYSDFEPGSEALPLAWCNAVKRSKGPLADGRVTGARWAFGWVKADTAKSVQVKEAAQWWEEIAACKKELDALGGANTRRLQVSLAVSLRERMNQRRRRDGQISYDDMISAVARAVLADGSLLLRRLREQYRYAVIDEFQDTNALQWDIFRRVFMEGDLQKLVVVGDPKQSIFRVQNADIYSYLEARAVFEAKEKQGAAEIKLLRENHRSIADLVTACNAIFKHENWFKVDAIKFEEATSAVTRDHEGKEARIAGIMETLEPKQPVIIRKLFEMPEIRNGSFDPPVGVQRLSYARYIVTKITEWHQAGIPYASMAILYETRTYAGQLFDLLRTQGIPYSQFKEKGLFNSAEAMNWTFFLDYCADDSAENLKKLLLTDFFAQEPNGVATGGSVDTFAPIAAKWSDLSRNGRWAQLMRMVFADTALLERAALRIEGKRVMAAYRQLCEWTIKGLVADHRSPADLAVLLKAFRAGRHVPKEEEDRFRRDTEGDAVRAMTMHAAKGLEFGIVFILAGRIKRLGLKPYVIRSVDGKRREKILVSIDDGQRSHQKKEDESESHRLLYVGLTRARFKMVLPLWGKKADRHYESALCAAGVTCKALVAIDATPAIVSAPAGESRDSGRRPRVSILHEALIQRRADGEATLCAEVKKFNLPSRRRLSHSYTSLAHDMEPAVLAPDEEVDGAEELAGHSVLDLGTGVRHIAADDHQPAENADLLPSSRETGIALHSILENLDFSKVKGLDFSGFEEYAQPLVAAKLLENGIVYNSGPVEPAKDAACREAGRLIWTSLNLRLAPDDGMPLRIVDIASSDRLTEAGFTATVNRTSGRMGIRAPSGNAPVDRAIGKIDLIFRSNRDVYLLDWKSDKLDTYDEETILGRMAANGYTLQAALYASAVNRWLTSRFPKSGYAVGGVYYVFLRGPAAIRIPVDASRIAQWENALADRLSAAAGRPAVNVPGGI